MLRREGRVVSWDVERYEHQTRCKTAPVNCAADVKREGGVEASDEH